MRLGARADVGSDKDRTVCGTTEEIVRGLQPSREVQDRRLRMFGDSLPEMCREPEMDLMEHDELKHPMTLGRLAGASGGAQQTKTSAPQRCVGEKKSDDRDGHGLVTKQKFY